jgi:TolB-like protein/Flp pilus assembly protein TadD
LAQQKGIKSLISNPLVQTFLIYVSGGWIVLEMTDYFIGNYGLSETFRDVLLIILLAGLPVALFLSWYLSREKEEAKEKESEAITGAKAPGLFKEMLKRPWFSLPGTVLFILIVVSLIRLVYQHSAGLTTYANIEEVSLAVLPFTNFTGNTEQEWLVAGQQEMLINELSKISQVRPLRVISRHTVNALKNFNKPLPEIARQINVEYLVEASVLGFGDSITLQLRLIQLYPVENVIWAESCSSDFTNILKLHGGIASQIAEKMNMELSSDDLDILSKPRKVNPESYKAYLRGMHHLNMDTPEAKEKGLEYLHEAVRIDPGDPFANAALALGYIEIVHGPLGTADDFIKAEAAANQALKLDTTLAEVYAAMAEVYLYKRWEFDKAERNFIKALELNPNLAFTHWHYGWALYLFGRMEEAIIENELAQKYDPFNPNFTAHLGLIYSYDGRHEDAIREALESLKLEKDYQMGYYALGEAYLEMGRIDDAIEAHKKLAELYPVWKWALGSTYAISGHRDEAEKILNELEKSDVNPFSALGLTLLYGALGKMDEAFKWLAYEPHHAWIPWVAVKPWSEPFHDDPRFEDFLKRLNLPE